MNFIEQCEDFLCRLFASVAGDVLKVVDGAASKEWGYTDDEAQSIAQYLEEKGLITRHPVIGGVGGIALTAEGIDYATNECQERSDVIPQIKEERHNIIHVLEEIKMELPKPLVAALADAITRIDLANCTSENETRYNIAEAIATVCSEFDETFDYKEFFTACCVWKP